jgi:hypothetical protein
VPVKLALVESPPAAQPVVAREQTRLEYHAREWGGIGPCGPPSALLRTACYAVPRGRPVPTPAGPTNPRSRALERDLAIGDGSALAAFWSAVERDGTPLVEPIPGDAAHVLVTFLWRATEPLRNSCSQRPLRQFTGLHRCRLRATGPCLVYGQGRRLGPISRRKEAQQCTRTARS